jgi:hypothetical protein
MENKTVIYLKVLIGVTILSIIVRIYMYLNN